MGGLWPGPRTMDHGPQANLAYRRAVGLAGRGEGGSTTTLARAIRATVRFTPYMVAKF